MTGSVAPNESGTVRPDSGFGQACAVSQIAELAALARVNAPQPLTPLPSGLPLETRVLAETLRVLFGALGMSLNRLAALLHTDPGAVSRYLSGRRIPPPQFIDGLCKAVYNTKGSLVTEPVRELVHEQFLAALREHNPARYEVQRLTDLLQIAAREKQQSQITVAALEEAIASRNEKIYALELEGRRIRSAWAGAESLLAEEAEQRMSLQAEIYSLRAQVRQLEQQLRSAHRRAANAEGRCRELEARLDSAGALLDDEPWQNAPADWRLDEPAWLQRYQDIAPESFRAYVATEAQAQSIRAYEPNYIHGLLQTEEYATAVISSGGFPPERVARLVALRRERQRRFLEGKLRLWVIADVDALRSPIAGAAAQVEQLRYLRAACAASALTLQILPPGAGAFTAPCGHSIMRFSDPDRHDIVYVETLANAFYTGAPTDLDIYRGATDRLSMAACQPHESGPIIDQTIADLNRPPANP
jgi:transcriptional regulator with XRE-family HTH domain